MGQHQSSSKHKTDQWECSSSLPEMYIESSTQQNIYRHPTLPSVKAYTIILNPTEHKPYQAHVRLRQEHPCLMQILHAGIIHSCSQYSKATIYIEHIPVTLQQLNNLPYQELLPVFYRAVEGMQVLFDHFGAFYPEVTMVGLNEEGQVKVWANPKYSKPKPKLSYKMINEEMMVKALSEMFISKVNLHSINPEAQWITATTLSSLLSMVKSQCEDMAQSFPHLVASPQPSLLEKQEKKTATSTPRVNIRYSNSLDNKQVGSGININYGNQISKSMIRATMMKETKASAPKRRNQSVVRFHYQ